MLELAAVHDQPLEIRRQQLASELVERTARHESQDRERQQLAVVIHLLDAEHLRRRHANTAPACAMTCSSSVNHGTGWRAIRTTTATSFGKLDAVRFVHTATGEANNPLDLAAADRPHH